MAMEEKPNKTRIKVDACTRRRLSIQHDFDESIRKKSLSANMHYYKHREDLFNKKLDNLRRNLEHIEPYVTDETEDDEEATLAPNCFARIQSHFRMLNFSPESEKRLLCQAPSYHKSNKQISNEALLLLQRRNSHNVDPSTRRVSFYQSRLPVNFSSRSSTNNHFTSTELLQKKTLQSFVSHQIVDEQHKQEKNAERKTEMLKEFDELKHTIDDPNSTLSALAALTRALLYLDSGTK